MKSHILIISFLSVVAFAVGCKPAEEKSAAENREAAAGRFDKVKQETKAAVQDMKDYTFAQKAQFTEEMRSRLAAINKDLDQIAARIEKSSDEVKAKAKPNLQAMREQTVQLNKQLDEIKNATESTWDTVKSGTRKAYDALKEGFQQTRQWVSDKIAP